MIKSRFSDLAEAVINTIEESFFLFNSDGNLIFLNKAGEEFIGSATREVHNRHYADLFHNSKNIVLLIQKALIEGRLLNCKDITLELDRSINIDLNLYPFYSDRNIEGVIVCIRENRLLMERGEDYNFDSLLVLLATIAHEIKNPLSGIKGAAQLLKDRNANHEERQYIDLIIKETDRLNSILYDYLSISRKPVFNDVNIHEVIEHALKVMESTLREKKIILYKSYDPSLPHIRGDESKLLQVFINLIKNAIEAMDKSKRSRKLFIFTKPASEYIVLYDSDISHSKYPKPKKQRWIIISFEDTGRGIPAEELNKIFLPFYSQKHGGTGLGLALSKKIIKDHGGTIMVKTKSNKGAMFNIYLPF